MSIFTICQSCGARVRIKTRVVGTGRPAECPKCRLPLTGPAIVPSPAKKRHHEVATAASPPPPELVPVGPCASCGTPVSVPREQLGRWIECSKCGAGFAAMAEAGAAPSPQGTAGSDSPAGRGGINWVGLVLALGAVALLGITLVVGTVMVRARMRPGEPPGGPAVPSVAGSRKEELLRRLEGVRARINGLEKRRDDLAQGAGEEDKDLDARLAVNKELKQARDEEEQLLADLERLSQVPGETGR